MASGLLTIQPYWHEGTWVFDDEYVGLEKEPLEGRFGGELADIMELERALFGGGITKMIDYLVKDIPNARSGFMLLFSSQSFVGYQVELTRVREEYGGYWYNVKDLGAEGWLCPALFKYFESAPELIYIKAEPSHRQFGIERTELEALNDRIDNLERLVGKLILKYDLLKKG